MSPKFTENGSFSSDKDKGGVDITFFSILNYYIASISWYILGIAFQLPQPIHHKRHFFQLRKLLFIHIKLQAARGAGQ